MKKKPKNRNYVHKYMIEFNKPKVEKSKKAYSRKEKHKIVDDM